MASHVGIDGHEYRSVPCVACGEPLLLRPSPPFTWEDIKPEHSACAQRRIDAEVDTLHGAPARLPRDDYLMLTVQTGLGSGRVEERLLHGFHRRRGRR